MCGAAGFGRTHDVPRPVDVGLAIAPWISDRAAHPDERREMEDGLRPVREQCITHRLGLANVHAMHGTRGVGPPAEIQPTDLVTVGDQPANEMTADEPGCSSDQNTHRMSA